jgi:diguanylate cyclase (GGDEF)-like protein
MGNEFKKIQLRSIILFASLILGITIYIIVLLTGRSNIFMRENAASLVRASNRQMELNIDSYLSKVEKASALLFSDSTSYTYNPSDKNNDAYTNLQISNRINNSITDLSLLDNYADFAIIYNNDQVIGSLSKVTKSMYVNGGMYNAFSEILDEENDRDAWVFGLNGDTAHIYYFERYNRNAIILISFYSRELKGVFQIPEQLNGMEVSLVNSANRILYSNNDEKIGSALPESTISLLGDLKNGSVMTNTLLITSDECSNGWRVVCTLPASLIVQDNTRFMEVTIIVILTVVAVILIFGVVVTNRMNVTANHYVDSLEEEAQHDRMTGLYNREEFHHMADTFMKERPAGKTMSFSIFDMDHFKSINDQHGHLEGDEVLRRFSRLLSDTFGSEFSLGRLGGDEFGVFGCMDIPDEEIASKELQKYIKVLRHRFNESLAKDYSVDNLSFCSGSTIVHKSDSDFSEVFGRADALLYIGKKSGKSQDHFDDRESDML